MLYKVGLTFEFVDEILRMTIQMKAIEQYFPVCFSVFYKMHLYIKFWFCLLLGVTGRN